MLTGKSVLHVNQDLGKIFTAGQLSGYYNNLTEKVTMLPELLQTDGLPTLHTEKGEDVLFPVAIFQYGLGAYDLYLQTGDKAYRRKFIQCGKWAFDHQQDNGAWNNFFYVYPLAPYGAMAQGEGASLLLRIYAETHNEQYKDSAKKAIDFMLRPINDGGTSTYTNGLINLHEYTHLPLVLNGFVFAWWGLYDYSLVDGSYVTTMRQSLAGMRELLPRFSNSYWSLYDLGGKIASPFYHNLHIAQMEAMFRITGDNIFKYYANKWKNDQGNLLKHALAFTRKAIQKIME